MCVSGEKRAPPVPCAEFSGEFPQRLHRFARAKDGWRARQRRSILRQVIKP